jgi:hypothetical protein
LIKYWSNAKTRIDVLLQTAKISFLSLKILIPQNVTSVKSNSVLIARLQTTKNTKILAALLSEQKEKARKKICPLKNN